MSIPCQVRTTAELVVGVLEGWHFSRDLDQETGCRELVIEELFRRRLDVT